MITAAIHQPNFLPWIGFFHKLVHSDVFVLFDDVQFPRGKSFGYRVHIKTNQGVQWLSVPIESKSDQNAYSETKLSQDDRWKDKMLKTIQFSYQKAPFFQSYFEPLSQVIKQPAETIFELNYALIKFVVDTLSIDTKLELSSELCKGTDYNGEEKIMYILKSLNAKSYISGTGAGSKRYLDESHFTQENIDLVWQEFKAFDYPQLHGDFIPNLSMLDLMMNCGEESYSKIKSVEIL